MTADNTDRRGTALLDHPAGTARVRPPLRVVLPGEVLPDAAEAATPATSAPRRRTSCRDVAIRMQLAMCGIVLPPDQTP